MYINETFELTNGDQLLLYFENGSFSVYDGWEFDQYPEYSFKPLYRGCYESCIAWIDDFMLMELNLKQ